jgi:hypothetical protein
MVWTKAALGGTFLLRHRKFTFLEKADRQSVQGQFNPKFIVAGRTQNRYDRMFGGVEPFFFDVRPSV